MLSRLGSVKVKRQHRMWLVGHRLACTLLWLGRVSELSHWSGKWVAWVCLLGQSGAAKLCCMVNAFVRSVQQLGSQWYRIQQRRLYALTDESGSGISATEWLLFVCCYLFPFHWLIAVVLRCVSVSQEILDTKSTRWCDEGPIQSQHLAVRCFWRRRWYVVDFDYNI